MEETNIAAAPTESILSISKTSRYFCNFIEAAKIFFRIVQIMLLIILLPILGFLWITYKGFHGPYGIFKLLLDEKKINLKGF
jgi:hypothetical protein